MPNFCQKFSLCQNRLKDRKLLAILCATFLTNNSLYLISPLLPIYFIESMDRGGLAWSKAEAFSVFGTFLSLLYIMPLIGGWIRDRWLQGRTELLGYLSMLFGEVLLALSSSPNRILVALVFLAIGTGCIKVSLTAMLGGLPKEQRDRGYDLHYNISCMGFISGALVAPLIFERFFLPGVACCGIVGAILSFLCYIFFLHESGHHFSEGIKRGEESVTTESRPKLFMVLTMAGLVFFACFNQLLTSIPVYVHQYLNRTVAGFSIPALWFGAAGSLMVTVCSPSLRKCWGKKASPHHELYILKLAFGSLIASLAFGFLTSLVYFGGTSSAVYSIGLVSVVHILCYIADFHFRPTLLGLATYCIAVRYHTLATGFVFACIGIGGKSAGILASQVDLIGFEGVFGLCCTICLCLASGFILFYRYLILPERYTNSI